MANSLIKQITVNLHVFEADLANPSHADAIVELVDLYARDVCDEQDPLGDEVRSNMIAGLRELPTTRVFLAFMDEQPAGVAVCFTGYSTFRAKPLINIHDLGVHPSMRGKGVGTALLDAVERAARAAGCAVITLEVDDDNDGARRLYERVGFSLNGDVGAKAQRFMKKYL